MVILAKNITNAGVISALARAETLILFLSSKGIRVKSVSLRHSQPVIRIAHHDWCEQLIKEGRARFENSDNELFGCFRQGVFLDESGCRVVWSESIH